MRQMIWYISKVLLRRVVIYAIKWPHIGHKESNIFSLLGDSHAATAEIKKAGKAKGRQGREQRVV